MSNIWSRLINLAGNITGVLPIANGGTNKALTLVNGGVIYSDADSFEVSAVGTAGMRLTSAGAATPIWRWQSTVAKSADYTITDTDGYDVILVTTGSSADVAITLPAAANNSGRKITFKKVDSGTKGMRVVGTVDGGSGASVNKIYTQYGFCSVVSDGSAWFWVEFPTETGIVTGGAFVSTSNWSVAPTYNLQWARSNRTVTFSGCALGGTMQNGVSSVTFDNPTLTTFDAGTTGQRQCSGSLSMDSAAYNPGFVRGVGSATNIVCEFIGVTGARDLYFSGSYRIV